MPRLGLAGKRPHRHHPHSSHRCHDMRGGGRRPVPVPAAGCYQTCPMRGTGRRAPARQDQGPAATAAVPGAAAGTGRQAPLPSSAIDGRTSAAAAGGGAGANAGGRKSPSLPNTCGTGRRAPAQLVPLLLLRPPPLPAPMSDGTLAPRPRTSSGSSSARCRRWDWQASALTATAAIAAAPAGSCARPLQAARQRRGVRQACSRRGSWCGTRRRLSASTPPPRGCVLTMALPHTRQLAGKPASTRSAAQAGSAGWQRKLTHIPASTALPVPQHS